MAANPRTVSPGLIRPVAHLPANGATEVADVCYHMVLSIRKSIRRAEENALVRHRPAHQVRLYIGIVGGTKADQGLAHRPIAPATSEGS